MRGLVIIAALSFVGVAHAGEPRAAVLVEFHGPHPIDPQVHAGLCAIEGPHMHSYEPHDRVLYVNDGTHWTFVGDPTEFEPAPPVTYAYYGHHPVWWTAAPGEHYCYITGPHRHGHRPPPTVTFTERGGAYWFVGAHPAWYEKHKKHRRHIDDHYHRHAIVRPVVTVAPPAGWIGVTFGANGVNVGIGASFGVTPVVIEHHHPAPVVIEHHDHHPPAWGHRKHDPRFPGKGGKHGKGKHK